jgi:uncharacterized UBP type Zn finger protein
LIIQIGRNQYQNISNIIGEVILDNVYNNRLIQIPNILNMHMYGINNTNYTLISNITHSGVSVYSGHYYTYAKNYFNDRI